MKNGEKMQKNVKKCKKMFEKLHEKKLQEIARKNDLKKSMKKDCSKTKCIKKVSDSIDFENCSIPWRSWSFRISQKLCGSANFSEAK